MKYATLGKTGIKVSAVSFGTAPLGGMFGTIDADSAASAIHNALDSGINFFDSSPYYGGGLAEYRLGQALSGSREDVIVGTKVGRYEIDEFDFSPQAIRDGVRRSLELLQTDYIDILQLHDIEFVPLGPLFEDAYAELVRLKDEGVCRFIGMTGYPLHALRRAVQECDLDVVLNYAHFTLLNTELRDGFLQEAEAEGTSVINAAAVALGLLTPAGLRTAAPVGPEIVSAADRARHICENHGVDISYLANQFSIQRSGCATTLIGTTKSRHLQSAVRAVTEPIDEDLLHAVLAATQDVHAQSWTSGLKENN